MLKRINRIKDFRIFRDFSWPNEVADFSRFNVIYGLNGAGKTTLSTLLRHVEKKEPIASAKVEFVFDSHTVNGPDLATAALPKVRVFNRDFVTRTVFETGGGQIPPVYYLGEDSAEKQKRILDLTAQLNDAQANQISHAQASKDASKALEDYCTEAARGVRNLLTVSGGGAYNNYDARNFKLQVQQLAETQGSATRLEPAVRQAHLAMRESKVLPKVDPLRATFPDLFRLRTQVTEVLRTSVVTTVLDDLATDRAVATWVAQGLSLHSGDRTSTTCRFCRQPLETDRIREIEAHFNDEFQRLKERISGLTSEIDAAMKFEQALVLPPAEALYEQLRPAFSAACTNLKSQTKVIQDALGALKTALMAKQDAPFQQIELESWLKHLGPGEGFGHVMLTLFAVVADGAQFFASHAGAQALTRLNASIHEHNQITESFDHSVGAARDALARDEVLSALERWREHSEALKVAKENEDAARSLASTLRAEIAALEAAIRQHHQPAEELNRELAGYLGRSELVFAPEQNGYRLMRGEEPAQHLSDGERTAVAFMYFLKSLQGTDFDLRDGIVVIDDPISSLDANSLFCAFGYMKDRTANAKQLFILTHNFSFFRQIHNWFKHVKPAPRYLTLQPTLRSGLRGAVITDLDPFLTKFESEYQYLFKRVYDVSRLAQGEGLEHYYGMPNVARRLLESYLAYRVPGHTGELFKKVNEIAGDSAKKTRVLRFLHTFSHGDVVAQPDHDPSVLAETQAVFRDLLDLLRTDDERHYLAMVQLCASDL